MLGAWWCEIVDWVELVAWMVVVVQELPSRVHACSVERTRQALLVTVWSVIVVAGQFFVVVVEHVVL